jgi:MFS family permease
LRANWRQFVLLVAVNGFVGAVVGMERTVVPLLGAVEFGLASRASILTFLVSFGVAKAISDAAAGRLADIYGRKKILLAGWIAGIPVPVLLIVASPPHWWIVVLANAFLGLNQGLCWSMTVVSKIDLVGPERRGFAAGINEFAGYVAVGGTAFLTGYIAASLGRTRPETFLVGAAAVILGFGLSAFAVRETKPFAELESGIHSSGPAFRRTFAETTWRDRSLFACSQGGLVNNLNDGIAWGLFPIFLISPGRGLPADQVGLVVALYPLSWGILQLLTGGASDRFGRKPLLVAGMWVQAAAFGLFVLGTDLTAWIAASLLLGTGTAMVYPTFLSAVSDLARPGARGATVGVYRFWRDLGLAVGAVLVGLFADAAGLDAAFLFTGILTFLSGLVVAVVMVETRASKHTNGPRDVQRR